MNRALDPLDWARMGVPVRIPEPAMSVLDLPTLRPDFQHLERYPTEEGRGTFVRMDFNEGPPPPLDLLSQWSALAASSLTRYPEYGGLRRAAAETWGVERETILPVNGADEGIALVVRAFTGPGDAVVMPVPTFPMYRIYAEQCATPVVGVPLKPDFQVDVDALIAALPQGTLVALTSPNNPTGRALPMDQIVRILDASEGRPVLLDETYAPYCGQDGVALLARYPNLLILRTLSKAYGLAGLRCGFLLGNPALIDRLDVLRSPFNVNAMAATLGAQVLTSDRGFRARLAQAVAARQDLQALLEGEGIRTVPSDTHFFLADLGVRGPEITRKLRAAGLLVKDMGRTLPGFLRVSVAGSTEAAAFRAAFLPLWRRG